MIRSRGRLSAGEGYDIALQLVDGLEAIHDQGIVHRDLKTSNVMIDRRGTALLMDFGIAKLWEGEGGMGLTAWGQIIGTPQYMSPEQAQGEPLDPRSDIYAIGIILFELFTGARPFDASNVPSMLYKKLHEPLQLQTGAAAHLPELLRPVIRKALATAAADRYRSTRELRGALLDASERTPVVPSDTRSTIVASVRDSQDAPAAIPEAVGSGSRRTWVVIGMAVAAIVLISIVVRTALPFLRSMPGHVDPSTVGRNIPPASVPDRDVSRAPSVAAPPSTAAGRSNAPPIEPSSTPSSSTSPNRETDGACTAMRRPVWHWRTQLRPRRISSEPRISTSRRATKGPPLDAPD